jgi:tripartite-type tricarboxylate transporter receptor subunit TctC
MTRGEGGLLPPTRRAMLALAMAAVGAGAARAQTDTAYPNRPVRIILPSAPGGPTDVMARMISPGLHARFSQPVIIVNRPGAAAILASCRRSSRRRTVIRC